MKTWYNSDGLSTSVETPQIARARQLQEMYNVLLNDLFDQDERIDILMTVKNTVKVFHPQWHNQEIILSKGEQVRFDI